MTTLLLVSSALILSLILTPVFKSVAWRLKILDLPDGGKIHSQPTPLLGGAAIYSSFTFITLFITKGLSLDYITLLMASTVIFIVGLVDDVRPLPSATRLFIQIAAAMIVIGSGVSFTFLPNTATGRTGEVVLTLIWIVGITNAFNYLDGLNGLITGVAVINAAFLLVFANYTGQHMLRSLLAVFAGACAGFFPYNFFRGGIFMGNAGSSWIGFMLACLAVIGHWAENNPIDLFIPILIFGVPIFDMFTTTVSRILTGKTRNIPALLDYKGKDHFHYKLSMVGLGNRGAAFFIFLASVLLGLNALLLARSREMINALIILSASALFFVLTSLLIAAPFQKAEKNI